MNNSILIGAAGVVAGAILAGAMAPQDPGTQDPAELQAIMEANSMKFMEVTDHHKELARRVGDWTVKVEFQNPDGSMASMDGTSSSKLIFGGLFVDEVFRGSMPAEYGGAEFEGRGLNGYDNFKERYVSMWIDSMGSGIYLSEGVEKDGALVYNSQMPDFMTTKSKSVRSVEKWISDTARVMEMYEAGPDGTEMMTMKITYTRAGGAR